MATRKMAKASDLRGDKLAQQRRGERRMQSGEAVEIEKIQRAAWHALAHPQTKLGLRRARDVVMELEHLSRERGETAAQSRRVVALQRRQQFATHAVAQKSLI